MPEKRTLLVVIGVVVAVAVVAFVLVRGADDDEDGGTDAGAGGTASTSPSLVPDEEWCVGWQQLAVVQGQYVATQSAADADAVLAVVDELQGRGVPESLDPSGYQELNAVLDDVRASVDPTFTPSVMPSEPADVAVEDDDHGDDDQGDDGNGGDDEHGEDDPHGADPAEAPFGAWLAEYCDV